MASEDRRVAAGTGTGGGRRRRDHLADRGAGARFAGAAGDLPGVGQGSRRGGGAGRGDQGRHPALRVRVRLGHRRAHPDRARRVHAGRQRRSDLQHRGPGGGPQRAARRRRGQGRRRLRGRAADRAGAARAAGGGIAVSAGVPGDPGVPGVAGVAEPRLVIRPWRVRWVAWIAAVVLFVVMTAVAVALRSVSTGVYFHTDDQVAMVLLGLFMSLGVLSLTLARVRADADGVEVRNLLITRYLPWSEVLEVSFPAGSRWARLELPDDEYLPVSAIQLVDGQRAVTAIGELRAGPPGAVREAHL